MRNVLRANRSFQIFGFLLLQSLTACATSADLEKLNQGLTQQLQSVDGSVQSRLAEIGNQLTELQAQEKERGRKLSQALRSAQVENKEAFDGLVAESNSSAQRQEELGRQAAEIKQDTSDTKRTVTQFAEKSTQDLTRIATLAGQLREELEGVEGAVRRAILATYEAEEAGLRERLKVLSKVREELQVRTSSVSGEPSE